MKLLLYLFFAGAAIYAFNRYAPDGTSERALAAVGLADFFQETLPSYARSKLSIPEDPAKKRERLLGDLSGALEGIEREIEGAAMLSSSGASVPAATANRANKTSPLPKSSVSAELDKRLEKAKELVSRSEDALGELEKANPQQGLIAKAAQRLVDKILPAAETSAAAGSLENGVGGDSGGEAVCPPR